MSKLAPTAFVALSLFAATTASADSKSWAAVKGNINPKATVVFGGNLDAVRGTKLFASAMQMFLDEEDEAKEAFALIKDSCAIDVPSAISDFTIVMKGDEKPLVVLGLNGVDEPKMMACLEAVALKKTGQAVKLSVKRKGKLSSYSVPGEKKQIHAAWLAKDVLAFNDDPSNKGKLEKMLAGKAAKGQLGKLLAKTSTTSVIWAAVAMKEKEDGLTMMGGYGGIELVGGKFAANAHIQMGSADEVQKALTMGQAGLDEMKKKASGNPAVAAMLGSIKLGGTGAELDVAATMGDTDVQKLMADFDHLF